MAGLDAGEVPGLGTLHHALTLITTRNDMRNILTNTVGMKIG